MALFTIGHSTLSQVDFLAMLGGRVATVVDVRSHPSSKWAQFDKNSMRDWLPDAKIGYEWWPGLGGWASRHERLAKAFGKKGVDLHVYAKGKFPKQRIGKKFPDAVDSAQLALPHIRPKWTNVGLYDYSWFMYLDEFLEDCDRLIERGKTEDLGFMCAECLWWKCHRSMIADYLAFRGVESHHVMAHWRQKNLVRFIDGYKLVPHSKALGNRLERYEPEIIERWKSWIRILSGGGRHEWVDASHREMTAIERSMVKAYDVSPMVCLHCGTIGWREKYTGRLKLVQYTGPDQFTFEPLSSAEKGCEYMIIKRIMET